MGSELGLSVRQWRVIFFLANEGQGSVQEIADFWNYDKSQASRALQELTGKGYVSRVASTQDRRKVIASLTEAGRRAYRRGLHISSLRDKRLKSAVADDELAAFDATLAKLADQAQMLLRDR